MGGINYKSQINMAVPPTELNHVMRLTDMPVTVTGVELGSVTAEGCNINVATTNMQTAETETTFVSLPTVDDTGDGNVGLATPGMLSTLNSVASQVTALGEILAGTAVVHLTGALLSRSIGGLTDVEKTLFPSDAVFNPGKTIIFDTDGTVGVYVSDIDSATISVQTASISPVGMGELTLLGNVATHTDLPLTVDAAVALFGRTPVIEDYVNVLSDSTFSNQRVEWYITAIDSSGNITWGNPVPLNTGDFQNQTTSADAGKVLTGGATAGTFGGSLSVDTTPTAESGNLVTSGAVYAGLGGKLDTNAQASDSALLNGNSPSFYVNRNTIYQSVVGSTSTTYIHIARLLYPSASNSSTGGRFFIVSNYSGTRQQSSVEISATIFRGNPTNAFLFEARIAGVFGASARYWSTQNSDNSVDLWFSRNNTSSSAFYGVSSTIIPVTGTITGNDPSIPLPDPTGVSGLIPTPISLETSEFNYSTVETLTGGLWIDGSPIYRIVLQGTITITANTQDLRTLIPSGVAQIVQCAGYVSDGHSALPLCFSNPVAVNFVGVFLDIETNSVKLQTKTVYARQDSPYAVVLEYTKL